MSDDNIIDFQEARAKVATSLEIADKFATGKKVCRHPRVLVADDTASVECKDCQAPLTAHAVLLGIARKERHFKYLEAASKSDLKHLQEKVATLKKEESQVKARVKRARATLAKLEKELEPLSPEDLRSAIQAIMDDVG